MAGGGATPYYDAPLSSSADHPASTFPGEEAEVGYGDFDQFPATDSSVGSWSVRGRSLERPSATA